MSQAANNSAPRGAGVAVVFGIGIGMAFTGYLLSKPAPVAVAAPVAAIDYAAITAAVKAGFPAPAAPVAAPAVKPAPVAAPAPVRRKVRKVRPAAAPVVYYVVAPRCACGV